MGILSDVRSLLRCVSILSLIHSISPAISRVAAAHGRYGLASMMTSHWCRVHHVVLRQNLSLKWLTHGMCQSIVVLLEWVVHEERV